MGSEPSSRENCRSISLEEIKGATNNFDEEKVIGHGGEGNVYLADICLSWKKGKTRVAVKQLKSNAVDFEDEIKTISKIQHPHLVSLLGYCKESGQKILIYEYMQKGSLHDYLKMDSSTNLSWKLRLNICIGAARGLNYLHTAANELHSGIIHRDLKPANILLDENWIAKVSDFGMLKLSHADQANSTGISTKLKGTCGYFAPEYIKFSKVTRKVDVYAFGVVLCEVLCRKKPWDRGDESYYGVEGEDLGLWAQQNVDPKIKLEISNDSLKIFSDIIGNSLQTDPRRRPFMDNVLMDLEDALKCQELEEEAKQLEARRECQDHIAAFHHIALGAPAVGILTVKVQRTMNVKSKGLMSVSLKLTKGELSSKITSIKWGNMDPVWNEEFNLFIKDPPSQALELILYAWNQQMGKHCKIGKNVVSLNELTAKEPKVKTLKLKHINPNDVQNDESLGQLVVELLYNAFKDDDIPAKEPKVKTLELKHKHINPNFELLFNPFEDDAFPDYSEDPDEEFDSVDTEYEILEPPVGTPNPGGVLVIIIHEARYLKGRHHTNPSVWLLFREQEKRTKPINKNRHPIWEEEFTFMLKEPPNRDYLFLEVNSTSKRMGILESKEMLGDASIGLSNVVENKRLRLWIPLQNTSYGGEINVELQWKAFSS